MATTDDNDDITTGYGTMVEVEDSQGAGTFTEIGLVHDVDLADDQVGQFDKTHMKSPGARKEYGSAMIEGGEGSVSHNWAPANDTATFMKGWLASRDVRKIRFTYPDGERETYPSTILGWKRTAPLEDRMTGQLSYKKAGDVVWDAV